MNKSRLEFIHPETLRHVKADTDKTLLFPSWYGSGFVRNLDHKPSETAWRNYVAWYLCSAGLPTAQVASLLTLSASRVRDIVSRARQKWLYVSSMKTMKFLADHDQLEENARAAHLLSGQRNEMAAAEYLLTRGGSAGVREISAALRVGRETYQAKVASLAGTRCGCRLCALLGDPMWIYWEER